MDQIIANICAYLALSTPGMNSGACTAALNSTYIQSGGKSTYDMTQNYYTDKGQKFIKENINDGIVYGSVGIYALQDIYKKKEIKFGTKCNMILCDTINLDVTQTSYSYSLGWNWKF
jgi:hypothetical protein